MMGIQHSSFIDSFSVRYYLVYQTVFFSLIRAHNAITLDVALDHFHGLAAVFGQYLAGQLAHAHYFFSVDPDVGRLTGYSTDRRLVYENPRIRERETLAVRACSEKQRSHRSTLAHADRRHIGTNELHRIVDGHTRRNRSARTINVQRDVAIGVFGLEKKKLSYYQIGYCVVDRSAYEDDVVF